MEAIIRQLRNYGVPVVLILGGVWAYRQWLETRKLRLEIEQLKDILSEKA